MKLCVGIFLILIATVLISNGQNQTGNDSISVLARKELNKRKESYIQQQITACKNKALMEAEAHVDSLIVAQIDLHLIDTLKFPTKPVKPPFPKSIKVEDSIKIKPIFDNSNQ